MILYISFSKKEQGGLAQLVERPLRMRKVAGSIPASSRELMLLFYFERFEILFYQIPAHILFVRILSSSAKHFFLSYT